MGANQELKYDAASGLITRTPGPWVTFVRNALHEVTFGWDERVGALGQTALRELRKSREAGNRAHPWAALAGELAPQLALGVFMGGWLATPLVQAAMAASRSLADSPEDLTTIEGLKTAVPRAGIACGKAVALTKGVQVARRALNPTTEYLAIKTFRPLAVKVRQMAGRYKGLARCSQAGLRE